MKLQSMSAFFAITTFAFTACTAPTGAVPTQPNANTENSTTPPFGNGTGSGNGTSGGNLTAPPPAPQPRAYSTAVLLFNGTGTSANEAASNVNILTTNNISFDEVDTSQINAMTAEEFRKYGVIVWPGGEAGTQDSSLTASTKALILSAIQNDGVGYVGICAGAFIAGNYGTWGLGITSQAFDYYQLENQGVTTAMTLIKMADGTSRDMVWYGGPQLNGFGKVIGTYPDGNPAIAEAEVGKGLVILSGIHPDAPEGWRSSEGLIDTDGLDFDLMVKYIKASLGHQMLPSL